MPLTVTAESNRLRKHDKRLCTERARQRNLLPSASSLHSLSLTKMVKIHSLLTTVISVICLEGLQGALADLHSQKPGGHGHGHGGHAIPGYRLTDSIVGRDFFRAFDWEAISDPTRGRVSVALPIIPREHPTDSTFRLYVNETESRSRNLTYAHGDSFVLRGDSETVLAPDGPGRPSARIVSKKSYTTHVVV